MPVTRPLERAVWRALRAACRAWPGGPGIWLSVSDRGITRPGLIARGPGVARLASRQIPRKQTVGHELAVCS
jgi:hypothetical protein